MNNNFYKLATLISRLFDPFLMLLVTLILIAVKSGINGQSLFNFLMVVIIGIFLPPALLLALAVKKKWVSGWDLRIREERIKPFMIMSILLVLDYFLLKIFGNAEILRFFIIILICFSGFMLITLFWKISGHLATLTLCIGMVIKFLGLSWWPLLVIIPVLAWSRVYRKNHTVLQVVGGTFYSLLVLLITLR
jgi:membrane-associated phospholipid phosphatase